jgi:hypothetical protein
VIVTLGAELASTCRSSQDGRFFARGYATVRDVRDHEHHGDRA